ncbi:protein Hook homolog 3-like [Periplaneta americana]|uniref:protein Hook homolog 3-like n=1 Tax=Periplaneta americana TaxID=6978 RepID=UPI0037E7868D
MDKAHLCESLMKWLQTFDLDAPHKTLEEVSDGVAMAQALTQIAPEWFGESWMSKIKTDAGNNWRLKVSNLKKILEGIVDYYQECLNQHLTDFSKPDVVKIGEKCDPDELGRLLQLILGCAINCNHKQDYITTIMAMEESVQQVIMQSIQELDRSSIGSNTTSLVMSSGPDVDPQLQRILAELEAAADARDQMAQRCHELDMQVTVLQEEKASVVLENQRLQDRLRELEVLEGPGTGTIHRYKETRKQLDALKEEMFKIETSRDDYRVKVEMQEKELLELQSKLEEIQKMADEARHLKDEVDILRETADKAVKYEATIASYKKKLEEYGDLKRQVKMLEDKNTDYMQQNMELEEELKKSGTWKPQLEMYKKQIAELHQRLNEETKRADKSDFECKKMQEKLNALQREKERLIIERDSLKETNEELKCSQLAGGNCTSGTTLLAETVSENMISPEIKEKLVRLQHENKMLRLNQRGPEDDKLSMVQALLDESTQRVNQLRMENRLANQRILELESQVEELQEGGGVGIRQRLADLQGQLRIAQGEKERRVSQLEEREVSIAEYKQKAAALQETLKRKEVEFQSLEERYKRYIEKAKSVIKTLDPKQNPGSAEVAVLRNQLLEKHKIIEDLEEEKEHAKAFREMEEKLMASAFYKLGLIRQREAVDQRLAVISSGQGQSFLARQRQATGRRVPQHQHYDSR